MNKLFNIKEKKGFTLIELIVYIGIGSAILLSIVSIAWIVIRNYTRQTVLLGVDSQGNTAIEIINYYAKRSTGLSSSSTTEVDPSTLVLDFGGGRPSITFEILERDVSVGGQIQTINTLKMTDGATSSTFMTSDYIDVSSFLVKDISTSNKNAIIITFGLDSVNPSNDKAYYAQKQWITTVLMRPQ